MNSVPKTIKIITLFFLILSFPFIALYFKFICPVDSFCRSIGNDEPRQQIISAGKAKGFLVWEWQENDTVWIVNHNEGTLFRVACSVRFNDGKLINKETVDAD